MSWALRGLSLVIAAVMVGLAVLAAWVAWPSSSSPPSLSLVSPTEVDQRRICPGPVWQLTGGAESFSSIGSAELVASRDAASKTLDLVSGSSRQPAARVLSAPTSAPDLAGVQSQLLSESGFSGLAVTGCGQTSSEAWLIGGSTASGNNTVLVVVNPAEVDSQVAYTIFDAQGSKHIGGLSLGSGQERAVSLAGIAPGQDQLAVHVVSSGAGVYAVLQHSMNRGASSGGVSFVTSANPPGATQYIPGVVVAENTVTSVLDAQILVRVFVPGVRDATVSVSAVAGGDSAASGTVQTALVPAGRVSTIALSGLTSGTYFLSLRSSEPILASAFNQVRLGSNQDLAWFGSATPLGSEPGSVAIPGLEGAVLQVQNPTTAELSLKITGSGFSQTVRASSGGTSIELKPGGVYELSGGAGLLVSVSVLNSSGLSSYLPAPPPRNSGAIGVLVN